MRFQLLRPKVLVSYVSGFAVPDIGGIRSDISVHGENMPFHPPAYFDNYRDKALREKIDGVSRREKFRIRYYNDVYFPFPKMYLK